MWFRKAVVTPKHSQKGTSMYTSKMAITHSLFRCCFSSCFILFWRPYYREVGHTSSLPYCPQKVSSWSWRKSRVRSLVFEWRSQVTSCLKTRCQWPQGTGQRPRVQMWRTMKVKACMCVSQRVCGICMCFVCIYTTHVHIQGYTHSWRGKWEPAGHPPPSCSIFSLRTRSLTGELVWQPASLRDPLVSVPHRTWIVSIFDHT